MDNHYITLSNKKRLVIRENCRSISIATVDDLGDVEYFLCSIDTNGVQVYTNSGDATFRLCEGLND